MKNIIERQTFVFSVDFQSLINDNTSKIVSPINLRFAADELIFKSIAYNSVTATPDIDDVVQIWCNITNDALLTAFPNTSSAVHYTDLHFSLSNTFQTGNVVFEFQQTANGGPFYYNPQPGVVQGTPPASNTNGILSFTVEFVKHSK